MKTQKTTLSVNTLWIVLSILTVAASSAAQTGRVPGNAAVGERPAMIKFVNESKYRASIFQITATGKEKLAKTVQPSETVAQSAAGIRRWRVRINQVVVGTYETTNDPEQVIEINVRQVESPSTIRNQKGAAKNCKAVEEFIKSAWIGKWGSLGPGQLSYCEFGSLRVSTAAAETNANPAPAAGETPKGVSLVFRNQTGLPFQLFKVDDDGRETLSGQIPGGSTFTQLTFVGRKWTLKTTDGKTLFSYTSINDEVQTLTFEESGPMQIGKVKSQKEADEKCAKMTLMIRARVDAGNEATCEGIGVSLVGDAAKQETPPLKKVSLNFDNQTQVPYQIFLVDENGRETLQRRVEVGVTYTQISFVNYRWRLKMNDGRPIGDYVATGSDSQRIAIIYGGLMRVPNVRNQKEAEEKCSQGGRAWSRAWVSGSDGVCEMIGLKTDSASNETVLKEVGLNFTNKTRTAVELFWVEPNGQERSYARIAAGAAHPQSTFATHKWKLKTTDGKVIGEFAAADQPSQTVEIVYDMGEVRQIRSQKEAEQECTKLAAAKGMVWAGTWSEVGDANAPFCRLIRLRIGKP